MAKIIYTHLCREIRKDPQAGQYVLKGSFVRLPWMDEPIGFVLVAYWKGNPGETFRHSFVVRDEAGNILDKTPTMRYVVDNHQPDISTAFFYAVFPAPGCYHIGVYQNEIYTALGSFDVIDSEHFWEANGQDTRPRYLPQ